MVLGSLSSQVATSHMVNSWPGAVFWAAVGWALGVLAGAVHDSAALSGEPLADEKLGWSALQDDHPDNGLGGGAVQRCTVREP